MNNKTIIAGIAATVAGLALGFLIYGVILGDFLLANFNKTIFRPEAELKWWALIISNIAWGFVLAILLGWANTRGFMSGLQRGLVIGFLFIVAFDMGLHFMSVYFLTRNALIVDIAANTVICGIVGGIIGLIYGSGKNAVPSAS
jgi:hypothetical protein